ncbi:MAG: small ribosomal subunit Rsm22 family protein [bacterium]
MKLPEEVENKILSELGISGIYNDPQFYSKKLDTLREKMVYLSQDFARLRATESRYQDAYFAFNFPQNFVKSWIIFNKIYKFYNVPLPKDTIKILDLGCGEGAAMLGLYYGLKNIESGADLYFTGVDTDNNFLYRCRAMLEWLQNLYGNINFNTIKKSLLDFIIDNQDEYDIIIISNALAEIFSKNTIPTNFVRTVIRHLKKDGIFIIIEPALKSLTRRLMEYTNRLKVNNIGYILLPCLHHNPCPLLSKRNEWCHQSIKWTPPEYMNILNQPLYRKIEYLKFSYLVISVQDYDAIKDNKHLVISRLFKEKGRKRVLLCNKDGIVELVRLDRDKDRKNQEFDNISVGDIVQIEKELRKRQLFWEIISDTVIKRLDF